MALDTIHVSSLIDMLEARTDLFGGKVLLDVSAWDEALSLTGAVEITFHPPTGDDEEGFIIINPSLEGATLLDPTNEEPKMPQSIEALRAGVAALQWGVDEGHIVELIDNAGVVVPPVALAQFLMDSLALPEEAMSRETKAYWMEVAEHMGPDWIGALRKVGAFMDKVSGF